MKYALRKEEIETKKGIKEWQLIYVDEGPGIAPEYRKSVFNKFFRIPNTQSGGTGLGLSIVKSIVELHNGKVAILDSEVGLVLELSFPEYEQPKFPEEY